MWKRSIPLDRGRRKLFSPLLILSAMGQELFSFWDRINGWTRGTGLSSPEHLPSARQSVSQRSKDIDLMCSKPASLETPHGTVFLRRKNIAGSWTSTLQSSFKASENPMHIIPSPAPTVPCLRFLKPKRKHSNSQIYPILQWVDRIRARQIYSPALRNEGSLHCLGLAVLGPLCQLKPLLQIPNWQENT